MKEVNNNQKGYFVFFGPANVGKSTMMGYIMTKDWSYDELLQQEQKFKEQFEGNYQQENYYSYFVDKNKDEYTKNKLLNQSSKKNKRQPGTSKEVHIQDF